MIKTNLHILGFWLFLPFSVLAMRPDQQSINTLPQDYFTPLPQELKDQILQYCITESPKKAIYTIKALLLTNKKNSQLLKNKDFIGREIKLLRSHFNKEIDNWIDSAALFNSATALDWVFEHFSNIARNRKMSFIEALESDSNIILKTNSVRLIQRWIDSGINVNTQNNYVSITPLMIAASYGFLEVVQMLLKAKANVNVQDNHDRTSLEFAIEGKHAEVLEKLINAEANISSCEHALKAAQKLNDKSIVAMLEGAIAALLEKTAQEKEDIINETHSAKTS